jgi:hypothetical protein
MPRKIPKKRPQALSYIVATCAPSELPTNVRIAKRDRMTVSATMIMKIRKDA